MKCVLITGAAGLVGGVLREQLRGRYRLTLLDLKPIPDACEGERVLQGDIGDPDVLALAMAGADAVVHLAGVPTEAPWEAIRDANIDGCYRVVEAARQAGVGRFVFASSNHAIGFYTRRQTLDENCLPRPDTRYGVSKVFGETLLSFYADKFGLASVCIRIGTLLRPDAPAERRHLSSWISHRDLGQLVERAIEADVRYEIVYGMSNNARRWWKDAAAERLGYHPQDDAETFAPELEGVDGTCTDPLAETLQGGVYCVWERDG